jgi:hypothetical protein
VIGVCALAYLPFTLLGYGTDIDVSNVLRAGRSWLDDRDYELSRGPGAAVHELATAGLDHVGGSVLVNLASVAFAALALWAVHELVRGDGQRGQTGAVLVLATNPWFWIAATSLGDFVWALALVLAGAVAAQRDRRVLTGLLFGLAIGCRASSVLLALAWLVAERSGAASSRRPWRAVAVTAAATTVVGALCFVPPWLDAGRTFDFLDNQLVFAGLGTHLGRWAVKNVAVVGVLGGLVLLVGFRTWLGALGRRQASTVVRFAVVAIVLCELLFLRFPFKPLHLLPVVAGIALVVGAAPNASRRWITALVVAQLVGGVVGTTLAAPDVADQAQSGSLELGITAGPLLTDVRCRLDDRDRGEWPDPASVDALERAVENASCQNDAWRAR